MLPFTCGARSFRYVRSTLKFSSKLSRRTQSQVKSPRTLSVLGVRDSCSNYGIQEVLRKNEAQAFSTPAYSLSTTCSSILLLTSDGGASFLTLALGAGDDDEVTTSAGKKRKHWIRRAMKVN